MFARSVSSASSHHRPLPRQDIHSTVILQKNEKDMSLVIKRSQISLGRQPVERSLGDTLKQRRQYREHIEKEREMSFSRIETDDLEPMRLSRDVRIRPSTPKLNLLKTRKNEPQVLAMKQSRVAQVKQSITLEPLPAIKPVEKKRAKIETLQIEDFGEERDDNSDEQIDVIEDTNEEEDLILQVEGQGVGLMTNFEEKFMEIMENEDVEDAIDLNEIFLSENLGVKSEELSRLTKLELRLDTSCHNLQVTGEILQSLEYLKMNDSIIKCFRDIGTSFKFVRILHLARCELKEVQGIQALENLEELYISYNFLDDLFDLGFLEHLTILDLEGNTVSELNQLYYLGRCKKLQHLNLQYNPVLQDTDFSTKLKLNLPNLLTLNDQDTSLTLSNLQQEAQKQDKQSMQLQIKENEVALRFMSMGINERLLLKVCEASLLQLADDITNEDVLVNKIRTFTKEKKAQQRSFNYQDLAQQRPQSAQVRTMQGNAFKRSTTQSMDPQNQKNVFRSTTNSFMQRSTGISSSFSELSMKPEVGADDIFNREKVMVGTPFSMLRKRQEYEKVYSLNHTQSSSGIPKDIESILKDFNPEIKSNLSRDDIRLKLTENSMKSSGSRAFEYFPQKQHPYQQDNGTLKFQDRKSSVIIESKGKVKIDKIVLKASDISFSGSFKKQTEDQK